MTLYPQQQEAFDAIQRFLLDSASSIFILRGYAGTGKTTMIKSILPILANYGKEGILMAPTGRAAKVLSSKTGFPASTIHRVIYEYTKMKAVRHDKEGNLISDKDENERSKGDDDLQFWFQIRKIEKDKDPSKRVFFVDESSMISSKITPGETLHFGTDVLLDDLLTYANLGLGGKVVFIGDPAQLPPVGDNRSAALTNEYFIEKGLRVSSFDLTDVIRQSEGSTVLKDAMMVRVLLGISQRNSLVFERKDGEVMDITPPELIDKFCKVLPTPAIGEAVVVCYSNSLVKDYNDAIRRKYFPEAKDIVAGDVLQVVKNNINKKLCLELYNGDFVRVLNVSQQTETQSAPVWKGVNGERTRVTIQLNFRDVTLQTEDGKQVTCKIIDSLLNSRDRSLNGLETVALYINFRMRHPQLKETEEAFKDELMSDPYFNAVQVKYGYAITAHKSQGGEWKTVFVDYSGRLGFNDDCLRWMYTATTRAQETLFGVNMPNITPLSRLTFNPINKISRPAKEAISFKKDLSIELLPDSANDFQRAKCISAKENLHAIGMVLSKVERLQYVDRYTIDAPDSQVVIDCQYNGAGIYTAYRVLTGSPEIDKILDSLKDERNMEYFYNYLPSSKVFEQLYAKVSSACDGLGISITNIVEHNAQYYVAYYLKTSGRFSQMMFYFNNSGFISHCLPSSDTGTEDSLLLKLIDYLK